MSIIGQKKELLERKIGENKSKIDWSLYVATDNYHTELHMSSYMLCNVATFVLMVGSAPYSSISISMISAYPIWAEICTTVQLSYNIT